MACTRFHFDLLEIDTEADSANQQITFTGLDKQKCSAYNCKHFLTHQFNICFGCSKEPIEMVLLSIRNMFWLRNKKISSLLHTLNISPDIVGFCNYKLFSNLASPTNTASTGLS